MVVTRLHQTIRTERMPTFCYNIFLMILTDRAYGNIPIDIPVGIPLTDLSRMRCVEANFKSEAREEDAQCRDVHSIDDCATVAVIARTSAKKCLPV